MATDPFDETARSPTTGADATLATSGADEPVSTRRARGDTGYALGEVLGRGGMGEVVLAHDPEIGRDVALKRMRGEPGAATIARFLREARIQARLDHPAIVPVHEIGRDPSGLPYFTMKRLAGRTLASELAEPHETPQRLLRALVDVCRAVEHAHRRGVVHRDLKPSNIMLGDLDEVYVIDWGVARVLDHDDLGSLGDDEPGTSGTRAGQILGTPGYMAPEQIQGQAMPASDVYAIGAILFEILAGERLHPRGTAALASTLHGEVDGSPVNRQPARSIAPELDAACVAALAMDPAARPTARQLGDRIQHYLDGDRDVERRRQLASELVARGRQQLAAGDRAGAVRLGGRALALDPESTEAGGLVMALVLGPPPEQTPPEVEATIAATDRQAWRERSQRAVMPYAAFFLLLPLIGLLEVESWPQLIGICATIATLLGLAIANGRTGRLPVFAYLGMQVVAVTMLSRLSGPFILTPIIICGVMLSAGAHPRLNDRPLAVVGYTAILVIAPFAVESLGLFTPTWRITPEGLLSDGTVFGSSGNTLAIATFVGNLATAIVVALFARAVSRDRRRAQRELHLRAWQLRQLLPT
jgi:eukaryotic-like serine/threonine-protein kinase